MLARQSQKQEDNGTAVELQHLLKGEYVEPFTAEAFQQFMNDTEYGDESLVFYYRVQVISFSRKKQLQPGSNKRSKSKKTSKPPISINSKLLTKARSLRMVSLAYQLQPQGPPSHTHTPSGWKMKFELWRGCVWVESYFRLRDFLQ